jgi:hypothetical protein
MEEVSMTPPRRSKRGQQQEQEQQIIEDYANNKEMYVWIPAD